MKRVFAAVYLLVLATQLPHVGSVYASLERAGWYRYTAWGAAVAFELSIAVFTYRSVVERSTRKSTRWGLGFFLLASAVANASYYGLLPAVMSLVMPVFATVALPAALGLFASEFGAEVRREERRLRADRAAQIAPEPIGVVANTPQSVAIPQPERWVCESCGREFRSRNALNAHGPGSCAAARARVAEVRRGMA